MTVSRLAAGASPSRRGFGIRLLSSIIDGLLGLVVALLLASTTGRWFAGRSGVMLSIGSPDSFWRGPIPMILSILGPLVYGLPFALLLVLLPDALFGTGPGKWLLRMRVAAADGGPGQAGRLWLRWVIKCIGLWGMALALALGRSPVAFIALAAGFTVLAGFFLTMGPRRQALHDRLSGTAVVPGR